jgi:hypothetical protein
VAVEMSANDRADVITGLMLQITQHAERLALLDQQVAALASQASQPAGAGRHDEGGEAYQPGPAPRWWKLEGAERDQALDRLCAWVEQVYRPGYGHLAATLGPCWAEHPLCIYGLDWIMELWSALYLTEERKTSTLASQAEWQIRVLPALAEQLHRETANCEHHRLGDPRRQAIQSALNRNEP